MKNIQTADQEKKIGYFSNTYPNPILLTAKEMAILSKPDLFPNTNHPRRNLLLVEKADSIMAELALLLENFPDYYRYKMLTGKNFTMFFSHMLNLDPIAPPILDKKSEELVIDHAVQLFDYSLSAILFSMPAEFRNSLIAAAQPFVSLLNGIAQYNKRNNLAKTPEIHIPDILTGRSAN